ncbi:unknown [Clostridium sp. CAG:1024]|nr:unknown [Clostridium sp. CAG:1024]
MRLKAEGFASGKISLQAELVRLAVRPGAEIEDAAVAQRIEILCGDLRAAIVIDGNVILRAVLHVFTDENGRNLARQHVELRIGFMPDGDHEYPVHLTAHQQREDVLFKIRIVRGVADHQIVTAIAGIDFQVPRQLAEEGVCQAGNDEAQDVGAALDHGARNRVRGIAHFLAQL